MIYIFRKRREAEQKKLFESTLVAAKTVSDAHGVPRASLALH